MDEQTQQLIQVLAQALAQLSGMDPQQALQTVVQAIKEAQGGNQQAVLMIQQLMQMAGVGGEGQDQEMAPEEAEAAQGGEQPIMAMHGAKLSYIKRLRGECPEGTEMVVFRAGGRVCKKCMDKKSKNKKIIKDGNGYKVEGPSEISKAAHRRSAVKAGSPLHLRKNEERKRGINPYDKKRFEREHIYGGGGSDHVNGNGYRVKGPSEISKAAHRRSAVKAGVAAGVAGVAGVARAAGAANTMGAIAGAIKGATNPNHSGQKSFSKGISKTRK